MKILFKILGFILDLPALVWALLIYLMILFLPNVGAEEMGTLLTTELFSIPLMSGDAWNLTYGDLFVIGGLVLLFVELMRSTQHDTGSIVNHILSLGLFIAYLFVFVIIPGTGTSTFFLLMTMALLDVVAGLTITISTARRDFAVAPGMGGRD